MIFLKMTATKKKKLYFCTKKTVSVKLSTRLLRGKRLRLAYCTNSCDGQTGRHDIHSEREKEPPLCPSQKTCCDPCLICPVW